MAAITVTMERRRAELKVNTYLASRLGLPVGVYPCYVLGIFQAADSGWADPVFACELDDGRVTTAQVEWVKFVDTVEVEQ